MKTVERDAFDIYHILYHYFENLKKIAKKLKQKPIIKKITSRNIFISYREIPKFKKIASD